MLTVEERSKRDAFYEYDRMVTHIEEQKQINTKLRDHLREALILANASDDHASGWEGGTYAAIRMALENVDPGACDRWAENGEWDVWVERVFAPHYLYIHNPYFDSYRD